MKEILYAILLPCSGEDTEFFDYSKVDDRPFLMEFEKMRNQDLEDAYFDND